VLQRILKSFGSQGRKDDKEWLELREEIAWLRNWGREDDPQGGTSDSIWAGKGLLGKLGAQDAEVDFLKTLLADGRKLY
jgi:hypothetical protein